MLLKKKLSQRLLRNLRAYPVYQAIALLLTISAIGYPKHVLAEEINANIAINFAQSIQSESMSGFLNSVDISIPRQLLKPLKPSWWRLAPDDLPAYLKENNSARHVQIVLSDGYGYPLNHWKGNPPPWFDKGQRWAAYVRETARRYKHIPGIVWDVWNEPDALPDGWGNNMFWDGTREQFFEVYRTAYTVLREELGPDAMIGGPSYASYDAESVKAFLAYCDENGLEVNVLSWHELDATDGNIASMAEHVTEVRQMLRQYPALKNQKILINEIIGQSSQYRTGDILAYLDILETAKVNGAIKACWNAVDGTNNCYNGSLDGLLDPHTKRPRVAWRLYQAYAAGVESRVADQTDLQDVAILASQKPLRVLLADNREQNQDKPITIRLDNLFAKLKQHDLTAELAAMPNTGEHPVKKLPQAIKLSVKTMDGHAFITLPVLQTHTAYILKLKIN